MDKMFVNVFIRVMEEDYDPFYGSIYDLPLLGIEEKFDEVMICFLESDWNEELKSTILTRADELHIKVEVLREEKVRETNWNEIWEQSVEPIKISDKITITPQWATDSIETEIPVIINPKMSFGTGSHPTTRMVARLLEKTVEKDSSWIDAGTGSGVLAVIAVKLGAAKVFAFDNDDWSIDNAAENFRINHVDNYIRLEKGVIEEIVLPEANGIAANLFTHLIIPSLPKFHNALKNSGGDLLISGILKYDADDVITAARDAGFRHLTTLSEDEWVAFHFKAE